MGHDPFERQVVNRLEPSLAASDPAHNFLIALLGQARRLVDCQHWSHREPPSRLVLIEPAPSLAPQVALVDQLEQVRRNIRLDLVTDSSCNVEADEVE